MTRHAAQLARASLAVLLSAVGIGDVCRRSRDEGEPGVGTDDVTEHFMVGGFASWLLAFTGTDQGFGPQERPGNEGRGRIIRVPPTNPAWAAAVLRGRDPKIPAGV